MEKLFHLKENHTDVKTEVMAGITTFMTMAYILAVNPNILSAAGMDAEAVLIATAPALIVVGFYMMGAVAKINFDDMTDAIPAFLTILVMPLAYSISEGIAIGIISWTLINVLTDKAKEKKITPLMYVLTVLFILKYIFL